VPVVPLEETSELPAVSAVILEAAAVKRLSFVDSIKGAASLLPEGPLVPLEASLTLDCRFWPNTKLPDDWTPPPLLWPTPSAAFPSFLLAPNIPKMDEASLLSASEELLAFAALKRLKEEELEEDTAKPDAVEVDESRLEAVEVEEARLEAVEEEVHSLEESLEGPGGLSGGVSPLDAASEDDGSSYFILAKGLEAASLEGFRVKPEGSGALPEPRNSVLGFRMEGAAPKAVEEPTPEEPKPESRDGASTEREEEVEEGRGRASGAGLWAAPLLLLTEGEAVAGASVDCEGASEGLLTSSVVPVTSPPAAVTSSRGAEPSSAA